MSTLEVDVRFCDQLDSIACDYKNIFPCCDRFARSPCVRSAETPGSVTLLLVGNLTCLHPSGESRGEQGDLRGLLGLS